jgi:hypothetical protein
MRSLIGIAVLGSLGAAGQPAFASAMLEPLQSTNQLFPLKFDCILAGRTGHKIGTIVGTSDPNRNPKKGNEGIRISWVSSSSTLPNAQNEYFFEDGEVVGIEKDDIRYTFKFGVAALPGTETGFLVVKRHRRLSNHQLQIGFRPDEYIATGVCKFEILRDTQ